MIPFLFNRKKGEAVIDSEAKQKTHSFFACLMGCITKRQEIWKIWEEIDNAKKELFSSLWDLIREFYQGDLSVNLTTLILYEGRLIPIGGLCQERFSLEQQKENLIRFRREINKFSEFLIQKFCEN